MNHVVLSKLVWSMHARRQELRNRNTYTVQAILSAVVGREQEIEAENLLPHVVNRRTLELYHTMTECGGPSLLPLPKGEYPYFDGYPIRLEGYMLAGGKAQFERWQDITANAAAMESLVISTSALQRTHKEVQCRRARGEAEERARTQEELRRHHVMNSIHELAHAAIEKQIDYHKSVVSSCAESLAAHTTQLPITSTSKEAASTGLRPVVAPLVAVTADDVKVQSESIAQVTKLSDEMTQIILDGYKQRSRFSNLLQMGQFC